MTKTKKFIIGTFISIFTLGGLIAVAGPSDHGRFGGMTPEKAERFVKRISKKLDLNEIQTQNLTTLKDTLLAAKATKSQQQSPQELIKLLLAKPVLDEALILNEVQTRTNKINQELPQVVSALANFTNSLSDEQRAKISERIEKHRGKRFARKFSH